MQANWGICDRIMLSTARLGKVMTCTYDSPPPLSLPLTHTHTHTHAETHTSCRHYDCLSNQTAPLSLLPGLGNITSFDHLNNPQDVSRRQQLHNYHLRAVRERRERGGGELGRGEGGGGEEERGGEGGRGRGRRSREGGERGREGGREGGGGREGRRGREGGGEKR